MRTIKIYFLVLCLCLSGTTVSLADDPCGTETNGDQAILVALLLDTSNSMDGLIDQAKSQLWRIVNQLAAAKCDNGSLPAIKIALYEYGNDGLQRSTGFIRQVTALTSDLDLISEKLFSLRTNGGNEYCGQVIGTSLAELAWSSNPKDLRMIFIAGNEPFSQGEVPFRASCSLAREKGIAVNTIFCGDYDEGIRTDWKTGADIGKGTYMSIQQDRKTVFISSPYDDQLDALNEKLNATYVYYGSNGRASKENQFRQDNNSDQISRSNKIERTIAKSSHAYDNSVWDLVDAESKDKSALGRIKESELPPEMKPMSAAGRQSYIEQKSKERKEVQSQIAELSRKRSLYLSQNTPKTAGASLDDAMLAAIRAQAAAKKMTL